jgi:hypothetical protein
MKNHNRIVIVILGCVIVGLLCNHLVESSTRKSSVASQDRWNYLNAVRSHYAGHELWGRNAAIQSEQSMGGNNSWHRSGSASTGMMELAFKSETPEIQDAVVGALIEIYSAMDVFSAPTTSIVADGEGLLASSEGYWRIHTHWVTDSGRVNDKHRILVIEHEIQFNPLSGPTEKQDLHRLSWVTWSPPLDR